MNDLKTWKTELARVQKAIAAKRKRFNNEVVSQGFIDGMVTLEARERELQIAIWDAERKGR